MKTPDMKWIHTLVFVLFASVMTQAQSNYFAAYSHYQVIKNEREKIGKEVYEFRSNVTEMNLKILQFQIKKSIAVLEKEPNFNNDSTFKKAALNLFGYYIKVSTDQYARILKLVEDPELDNDEYRKQLDAIYKELSELGKPFDQAFFKEEEIFTQKYGIKIE